MGLEHGSRGIANINSRYQAKASEERNRLIDTLLSYSDL
jgi:hypothetical protein